jgi:hypothetical protein
MAAVPPSIGNCNRFVEQRAFSQLVQNQVGDVGAGASGRLGTDMLANAVNARAERIHQTTGTDNCPVQAAGFHGRFLRFMIHPRIFQHGV